MANCEVSAVLLKPIDDECNVVKSVFKRGKVLSWWVLLMDSGFSNQPTIHPASQAASECWSCRLVGEWCNEQQVEWKKCDCFVYNIREMGNSLHLAKFPIYSPHEWWGLLPSLLFYRIERGRGGVFNFNYHFLEWPVRMGFEWVLSIWRGAGCPNATSDSRFNVWCCYCAFYWDEYFRDSELTNIFNNRWG